MANPSLMLYIPRCFADDRAAVSVNFEVDVEIGLLIIVLLLGIGIVTGVAAGFIGIGGGVIMVPVLLELYRIWALPEASLVQAAMGTSLTVGVLTGMSSTVRHHRQGTVMWRIALLVAPTAVIGGFVGSRIAVSTQGSVLQIGLAAVLLLAAIDMILRRKPDLLPMKSIHWLLWMMMGVLVGLFAAMSGLGGGLLFIPLMVFIARVPTGKLAGTSSVVVIFAALASAIRYMLLGPVAALPTGFVGHSNFLVALCLAVAAVPGAQLGAYLNKVAGSIVYRRIFAVLLLFMVIRLFATA